MDWIDYRPFRSLSLGDTYANLPIRLDRFSRRQHSHDRVCLRDRSIWSVSTATRIPRDQSSGHASRRLQNRLSSPRKGVRAGAQLASMLPRPSVEKLHCLVPLRFAHRPSRARGQNPRQRITAPLPQPPHDAFLRTDAATPCLNFYLIFIFEIQAYRCPGKQGKNQFLSFTTESTCFQSWKSLKKC